MKTILAAILGGMVVFAWGAVSWMVLQWHEPTLKVFADEATVGQTLIDNAPVNGVYVLPKPQNPQSNTHPQVTESLDQAASAALGAGPFAFVAFTREGTDPQMTRQFAYAIAIDILAALLIVLLVKSAAGLGYLQRVVFIATVGIVIALAGRLPYWIWWHFSADYMIVDCADTAVSWFLAALVMAALTGEERSRLGAGYRRARI